MSRSNPTLLDGDVSGHLRRLVGPLLLGYSAGMANSLVDLFFLGKLSTAALAAYSFNLPITTAIVYLAASIGIGVTTVLSNALGAREADVARHAPLAAMILSLAAVGVIVGGILVFYDPIFSSLGADESLRAASRGFIAIWLLGECFLTVILISNACLVAYGETRIPSMLLVGGAGLRFALEPALIFGFGPIPALGLDGAAWSNVIIWAAFGGLALKFAFFSGRGVRISIPNSLSILTPIWRRVIRIGAPTVLSVMTVPFSVAVLTSLIAAEGAAAVAAFGLAARIEALALVFVQALSYGAAPMIGQSFGAGDFGRVRDTLKVQIRWLSLWGFCVTAAFFAGAPLIVRAFIGDGEASRLTVFYFAAVPFSFFFYGLFHGAGSLFTTIGRPSVTLLFTVGRNIVLLLPAAYLLGAWYGAAGVFASVAVTNCVIGSIAFAVSWASLPRIERPLAARVSRA